MHIFAAAASLAAALLVAASASASEPPPSPSPSTPAPAAPAAPPAAAPSADVMAPPAAAPPPPGLGYATPYAVYAAPGPGAPYPYWMGRPPVTERRSNSMRTTGIVLFSVGGLVSAAGATMFALADCRNFSENPPPTIPVPEPAPASARGQGGGERIGSARQALNTCRLETPGIGFFIGGLATAIAGIPLFVIGSKQVPVGPAKGMRLPAVSVGAGNASLRWTF